MDINKALKTILINLCLDCGTTCAQCDQRGTCKAYKAYLDVEEYVDETKGEHKMNNKQAIIELHFLMAEVNKLDNAEIVKEAFREALKKAIYALENQV